VASRVFPRANKLFQISISKFRSESKEESDAILENDAMKNGKTGKRENGKTGKREKGKTGKRENGKTGKRENGNTGKRKNGIDKIEFTIILEFEMKPVTMTGPQTGAPRRG
jgi:hypothetical protein